MGIRKPQGASSGALAKFIGAHTFSAGRGGFDENVSSISGLTIGDLLVIAFSFGSNADGTWSWATDPGDFSFTDVQDDTSSNNPGAYLGYAIYDGTNTSFATSGVGGSSWGGLSGIVAAFRGVNTLVNSATATGLGSPDGPSVSGAGILHVVSGHVDNFAYTPTAPDDWLLAGTQNGSSGGISTTAIAYNFDGLSDPDEFGNDPEDFWRATTSVWT